MNPFQNNDPASMQYRWDWFVVVCFFRYSFLGCGMYIDLFQKSGCPPVFHSFMSIESNCPCSGSFIGTSSCLWTFPSFILLAVCAALDCNSGGSVLTAQSISFIWSLSLHSFFLSAITCFSSTCVLSPLSHYLWRKLLSNAVLTVLQIFEPTVMPSSYFLVHLLISLFQFLKTITEFL